MGGYARFAYLVACNTKVAAQAIRLGYLKSEEAAFDEGYGWWIDTQIEQAFEESRTYKA